MENQILNDLKESRSKKLLQLSAENQEFYHQQYIGKKLEIRTATLQRQMKMMTDFF